MKYVSIAGSVTGIFYLKIFVREHFPTNGHTDNGIFTLSFISACLLSLPSFSFPLSLSLSLSLSPSRSLLHSVNSFSAILSVCWFLPSLMFCFLQGSIIISHTHPLSLHRSHSISFPLCKPYFHTLPQWYLSWVMHFGKMFTSQISFWLLCFLHSNHTFKNYEYYKFLSWFFVFCDRIVSCSTL